MLLFVFTERLKPDQIQEDFSQDIINIYKIDSVGFAPERPLYIKYQIRNLGNHVIRLVKGRSAFNYGFENDSLVSIRAIEKNLGNAIFFETNSYVTKDQPTTTITIMKEPISSDTYNLVRNGHTELYLALEHYYQVGNQRTKRFQVILRLGGKNITGFEIKKIENAPL